MINYPFPALVGQDDMKLALILAVLNPSLGGVLIRGEKGTAKSTAVRGLAALLPPQPVIQHCRFGCHPEEPYADCPDCRALEQKADLRPTPLVDLPIGATEDRVLGTLDLEEALAEGRKTFEPGLLASAHRGILYVDEVNLLDDHLVDVLLDAAAMGVNTVEREGLSLSHPAKFTLIGTMNPEEGELRPQLLDRFGLCVKVSGLDDPEKRREVVLRRLEFDREPEIFAATWRASGEDISRRLLAAAELLPRIELTNEALDLAVTICLALDTDGHRGDLTLIKTALTLAAWENRRQVQKEDLFRAAALALPHRMRRKPFQEVDFNVTERLKTILAGSAIGAPLFESRSESL